jgi:hypothetical protein
MLYQSAIADLLKLRQVQRLSNLLAKLVQTSNSADR